MDIATIIGIGLGTLVLAISIILGGSAGIYLDLPSILIVVGGSLATVFIRFTLVDVKNSVKVALNAFFTQASVPREIIAEIVLLANIARKNGLIVLENHEIKDPFLKKAILYCVDGYDADFIKELLNKEIFLTLERHQTGQSFFKGLATAAPAFGMIGTLVGLVKMMSSMKDPASIGPAMALALLTTLYGAVIANLFMLPIADKLTLRSQEEERNRQLIVEGVLGILKGINPRVMEEFLETFLPPKQRGAVHKE